MRKILIFLLVCLSWTVPAATKSLLDGSKASLAAENAAANRGKLTRIRNDAELAKLVEKKHLVPLPENGCISVNQDKVKSKFRFVRPKTRAFLLTLGARFCHDMGSVTFVVNSAVRTMEYQKELRRKNKNAARCDTLTTCSTHITGATIDIAKRKLTEKQIMWLRKYLSHQEAIGRIHTTEEWTQTVFHIMVIP